MSCTNEVQCENMECDSNASSSHLNSKSKLSNAKKIKDDDFVEIDYELLVGEKKNSLLLSTKCDQNLFQKHSLHALGVRYRCRERPDCHAFVIYCNKTNRCMRLNGSLVHKHKKCSRYRNWLF